MSAWKENTFEAAGHVPRPLFFKGNRANIKEEDVKQERGEEISSWLIMVNHSKMCLQVS